MPSFDPIDFRLICVPVDHYDEPEILPYPNPSICPVGADVGQRPWRLFGLDGTTAVDAGSPAGSTTLWISGLPADTKAGTLSENGKPSFKGHSLAAKPSMHYHSIWTSRWRLINALDWANVLPTAMPAAYEKCVHGSRLHAFGVRNPSFFALELP